MNSRARYLLRSIALGLPIVGASALAGCASTRNCDPEPVSQRFEVTAAQLASLEDCPALCEELQQTSGRAEWRAFIVAADNACDPVMDDGGLSIECRFVPGCL